MRAFFLFVFSLLTVGLAGCTGVTALSAGTFLHQKIKEDGQKLLRITAFEAIDMLAGQARSTLQTGMAIDIPPVAQKDPDGLTRPFGTVLAEHFALRATQLGLQVQNGPEHMADAQPASMDQARLRLDGTYQVREDDVLVDLRLYDRKAKRIVATHYYTLPQTQEIRDLILQESSLPAFF